MVWKRISTVETLKRLITSNSEQSILLFLFLKSKQMSKTQKLGVTHIVYIVIVYSVRSTNFNFIIINCRTTVQVRNISSKFTFGNFNKNRLGMIVNWTYYETVRSRGVLKGGR